MLRYLTSDGLSFLICKIVVINLFSKYLVSTRAVKSTGDGGEYGRNSPWYTIVKRIKCKNVNNTPGRELGENMLIKYGSYLKKLNMLFGSYLPL